jgi:uncharacterized protein YbbC (DUF1343 family)
MTIAEVARYAVQHWGINARLRVVPMMGWIRESSFAQSGLPWVLPSPNFPSTDTAQVYPGTVLFEGSSLSEGRGTTRPFELIGHPQLAAYPFADFFAERLHHPALQGAVLRTAVFIPTFDKYAGQTCNGFQIHVRDPHTFLPWTFGQALMQALYQFMGPDFTWRQPPFEYVYDRLPTDLLNGSDQPRLWIEQQGTLEDLRAIEQQGYPAFLAQRQSVLMYP